MISTLSIKEFKERLAETTKEGNLGIRNSPFAIFSIFGESNKNFYGNFNNTSFQLTKNNILRFGMSYTISGTIRSINANETEVSYGFKKMNKLTKIWFIIFPIFTIIMLNTFLVIQSKKIEIFLLLNTFIIIGGLFYYLMSKFNKKELEKSFRRVFEIID